MYLPWGVRYEIDLYIPGSMFWKGIKIFLLETIFIGFDVIGKGLLRFGSSDVDVT